jgi:hypothetical protein
MEKKLDETVKMPRRSFIAQYIIDELGFSSGIDGKGYYYDSLVGFDYVLSAHSFVILHNDFYYEFEIN